MESVPTLFSIVGVGGNSFGIHLPELIVAVFLLLAGSCRGQGRYPVRQFVSVLSTRANQFEKYSCCPNVNEDEKQNRSVQKPNRL